MKLFNGYESYFSGMCHHVMRFICTDISEEPADIFQVEYLYTRLHGATYWNIVTSNRLSTEHAILLE
jgi:hypothetical protein